MDEYPDRIIQALDAAMIENAALRSRVEQLTEVLREVLADPFGLPEGRWEEEIERIEQRRRKREVSR